MRLLHLVSPLMRGRDVADAQWLLAHNRYGKNYLDSPVDGVFGPASASACKRAKYWAGYATKQIEGFYGPDIRKYLLPLGHKDAKRLSVAMATRRNLRLRKARRKPPGVLALALAKTQLGVHESPAGSNYQKYGAWYGFNGVPWCAIFISWCFSQTGRSLRYSYVPFVVEQARAGRDHLSITHSPVPGTVVCYDWDGGVADHIGIFEGWADKYHQSFHAIEGNTSPDSGGSQSNGGEVCRRLRYTNQVQAFVRVSR